MKVPASTTSSGAQRNGARSTAGRSSTAMLMAFAFLHKEIR